MTAVSIHYVEIFIHVSELPESIPITKITGSGSAELGQSFYLSCSVTLVERMVVSPGIDYNITWTKLYNVSQGVIGKDIDITTVTAIGDPTTTVTLTFDPLTFGDKGTYICIAEFNITQTLDLGNGSDVFDIICDSEL